MTDIKLSEADEAFIQESERRMPDDGPMSHPNDEPWMVISSEKVRAYLASRPPAPVAHGTSDLLTESGISSASPQPEAGPSVDVEAPEVVYRWRALDYTGFCYTSGNPPSNLPGRCCLQAFYAQPDYAVSTLYEIAYCSNSTATPQQFADHLQREAKRALARQLSAAQVPDAVTLDDVLAVREEHVASVDFCCGLVEGWNKCREAMLSASAPAAPAEEEV